ncbi:MAG: ABC transporter permease [Cyclobacteriaceae bacterium]
MNFKIALRNAGRNKWLFSVKMISLSMCLAFALLLSLYVLQEFSYDEHIQDHDRIYKVAIQAEIDGVITKDAESPEALASTLKEEIAEIENAGWYDDEIYNFRHDFEVNEQTFHNEHALTTSADFADILEIKFLSGSSEALNEWYSIVLTESTAIKFFGEEDPIGKSVGFNGYDLNVVGIVEDPPNLSHLEFDALLNWETFDYCECWGGVNAYTYMKLVQGADINEVKQKIDTILDRHKTVIAQNARFIDEKELKVTSILTNIGDIHLENSLIFDNTKKRSLTNLHLLTATAVLFFIAGFVNFLGQSLAELTISLKRIGLLQLFGGGLADHSKTVLANTLLSVLVIFPLTLLFYTTGAHLAKNSMGIMIESDVMESRHFMVILFGFVLFIIFSSSINSFVISRSKDILTIVKGKLNVKQSGFHFREILVGAQLSFSIVMIALIFIVVDQFQFINEADKGLDDKNTLVLKMPYDSFSNTEAMEYSLLQLNGVDKVAGSSIYTDENMWGDVHNIESENGEKSVIIKKGYWGYGFADLLGIRILRGRDFDREIPSDKYQGYLINEAAAKEFGWENPIGKEIDNGHVIGLIKDFSLQSMHKKIKPIVIHHGGKGDYPTGYVFLKLDKIRSSNLLAQIEEVYHEFYPDIQLEWDYLDASLVNLYQQDYQVKDIFKVGLVISVMLSCLAIFSISALLLHLRAKEMSIRKVVGASQLQLFGLHIMKFAKFILMAVFIAWPIAFYLSDYWLNNFAFRIDLNMWYFIIPGLLTLMIVLLTSCFHAMKNSQVNPIEILNQE